MATSDTSIYNNLLRPAKSIAEYDAEARAAQQDRMSLQMNRNKLAEYDRGIADEAQMRGVVSQFGADKTENYNTLIKKTGNMKAAQAYEEHNDKTAKARRDADKENLSMQKERWVILNEAIAGSVDPASFSMNRSRLQSMGIDVSGIPEKFDPAFITNSKNQAVTEMQRIENEFKAKKYDLDERQFGEVVRNNKEQTATSRANNASTNATTMRGQNMTDSRQRETTAAGKVPAGYRANADGSMSFIPGGPADPSITNGKMTEDQGKATGWLIQAENAYKNMMAVGVDKKGNPTSAAKPGFNDALASVPGFSGAANAMRGADRQKFMQSTSSLGEAFLRAATGAGVNKDEAAQKIQELTPLYGEDDEVTKQKYKAIPLYIESLKVRAGPGAGKAAGVLKNGATPSKNSKGWELHTDANGNRAYVSPDGKQFEEPK